MSQLRRPSIKGRDSSGREVSLLNSTEGTETSPSSVSQAQPQALPQALPQLPQLPQLPFRNVSYEPYETQTYSRNYSPGPPHMARTNSNASVTSNMSLPSLLRSDSYDSYCTTEARSPITPTFTPNNFGRNHSFPTQYGKDHTYFERNSMEEFRPTSSLPSITQHVARSTNMPQYPEEQFYRDDSYHRIAEKVPEKRFPCRYKDTHRCNKTFTTSGHASRHAKIHTAEKMVRCTHAGCTKKFTRADNMKQHLDTHNKEKSRSSSSATLTMSGRSSAKLPLTLPARVQKRGSPAVGIQSPRPRIPSRMSSSEIPPFDLRGEYQMGMQANFHNLPTRSKGPTNNLDILADLASHSQPHSLRLDHRSSSPHRYNPSAYAGNNTFSE